MSNVPGGGLPASGVVALCDFGRGATSITLADAGAGLAPIGQTVSFPNLSGDLIDQALLNHVLTKVAEAGGGDPASTAAIGSLTGLGEQCRLAKELLSTQDSVVIPVDLPGFQQDIPVTRAELESIITGPFTGFLDALADVLEDNRIPATSLTAIGVGGGGATIPMITRGLSEQLRVPVVAMSAPDAPTSMAPAATGAAPALAWSQDEASGEEPVPYTGPEYSVATQTGPAPESDAAHPGDERDTELVTGSTIVPWYRRPTLLFGVAAAVAAVAVGGLAITLTSSDSTPTTTTTRVTKPGEAPGTATTDVAPPTTPPTTVAPITTTVAPVTTQAVTTQAELPTTKPAPTT